MVRATVRVQARLSDDGCNCKREASKITPSSRKGQSMLLATAELPNTDLLSARGLKWPGTHAKPTHSTVPSPSGGGRLFHVPRTMPLLQPKYDSTKACGCTMRIQLHCDVPLGTKKRKYGPPKQLLTMKKNTTVFSSAYRNLAPAIDCDLPQYRLLGFNRQRIPSYPNRCRLPSKR